MLIVFGNMIADMLANRKLSPIVTELFLRERKINISQYFFKVRQTIGLNAAHYFIMKISKKYIFNK